MHNIFDNPAAFKPFFGDAVAASYEGARREDGQTRRIFTPIDVLAQRSSKPGGDRGESVAMNGGHTWEVSFPSDRWPDDTDPQIGDSISFTNPEKVWETVQLRVASVAQDCGWWTLKARPERSA